MGKFFTNYFTFTPCTGFHLGHQGTDIPRSRNARHPILHGTFPIPILHHPTGYQLATRDAMWCIETVVWIGNCWRYIINVRWWSLYSVWYVTFPISIANSLPETLCDTLRQWFELFTAGDISWLIDWKQCNNYIVSQPEGACLLYIKQKVLHVGQAYFEILSKIAC